MAYLDRFHHMFMGNSQAPKLVFLHGLMGYGNNWRRIAKAFESEFHILLYDQRGHGLSFQPDFGYAPEDYSDDLLKIMDELGWQKIYLVGHSMGGRNAHNFTFRFPERVEKLIIEDIGPEAHPESIVKTQKLLDSIPTPFVNKNAARVFFREHFLDKVLGEYLLSNLKDFADGHCDWRFSRFAILESVRCGRNRSRWEEIESLRIPTLVMRGENTDELLPEEFQRMLTCNPLVQGIEVKNSGHWIHFDQPEEFIQILRNFFAAG